MLIASAAVSYTHLGKPLSCNAIKVFANRLKHQLPFEFSSHKLRHNFATNYCIDHIHDSGNTNVYDLSIIMGHESIETTKKYEHFAHEMLALQNRISHLDKVYKLSLIHICSVKRSADCIHCLRIMNRHQIKPEAVYMIFLCPVKQGIYHIFTEHSTFAGGFIACLLYTS